MKPEGERTRSPIRRASTRTSTRSTPGTVGQTPVTWCGTRAGITYGSAGAGRGGDPPLVYPMPGEEPARAFLDDWQAAHLLHTPWDERVAYIFLLDPGRGPGAQEVRGGGGVTGILYDSAVVEVEGDGIWVASYDGTGRGQRPAFR